MATITIRSQVDPGEHDAIIEANAREYGIEATMIEKDDYTFLAEYTGDLESLWNMYRECFAGSAREFNDIVHL